MQNFLRRSEAVRGLKPTTQPDVVKSFRRPFSPTMILHIVRIKCLKFFYDE
jgi:hypothetical protein